MGDAVVAFVARAIASEAFKDNHVGCSCIVIGARGVVKVGDLHDVFPSRVARCGEVSLLEITIDAHADLDGLRVALGSMDQVFSDASNVTPLQKG